jgi:uncharacterized protein DUF4129
VLADSPTLAQYKQRLDSAHQALVSARATNVTTLRATAAASAKASLLLTESVALPSGVTLAIDDRPLATFETTDSSLDSAIARLDARIAIVARLGSPTIDPATADARLRDVVTQSGPNATGDIFSLLGQLVLRFFSGLRNPDIDPRIVATTLGLLGIAVIVFIVATLGRALPERVRREVLVRDSGESAHEDPAVHLRDADAAIAGGHPRDALHALFLYAIGTLAAREVIRYDPALTDAELLLRASGIPHADALRELVGIYERAWFGLREPTTTEVRRARELALRVAP